MLLRIIFGTIAFVLSGYCFAQSNSDFRTNPSTRTNNNTTVQDSSSAKKKSSFGTIFAGQPGKAALYSLILPGAGQVYNKRYWKLPLVIAAEGVAAYFLIDRINTYSQWNACYISTLDNNPAVSCQGLTDQSRIFKIRQSARTNKELAWVFMGGAHLFIALEAFIDRHLINFDTSEDLSIQLFKPLELDASNLLGMQQIPIFQISIPLNRNYYESRTLLNN